MTGASTLSGGTESGSGTTNAQGGAAFSNGGFALDGGHTLQLGGASTASGTSVQINLNGTNPTTGLSDAGSGILTIGNGATFNDQTTSSGLNIVTGSHGGSDTGTTAVVNNAGTFTKSGSAATSTISTLFNNTGTVDVQSGTLNLSAGGTDVGAVYKGAGTVNFSGGTRTLDSNSSITGKCDLQRRSDDGQWRLWHWLADGHWRDGDLQWGGNDRCIGAERGRTKWFGHADGDGRLDFVGRDGKRFWDDQCAGWGGV